MDTPSHQDGQLLLEVGAMSLADTISTVSSEVVGTMSAQEIILADVLSPEESTIH